MIITAIGVPMVLAYVLVAADVRSDLSDLKPHVSATGPAGMLAGWPDIEKRDGKRTKMLGYMMDGYKPSRDGTQVDMFMLMPEAGQFLHPAHRIPEEMAEVWLLHSAAFKDRSLVWVSGVLEKTSGPPDSDRALYAFRDAVMEPAPEADIARFFHP